MIRRGHYSSNNFQDSIKRKITEKKTVLAVGGNINVKEWTGVHSSLEVSLRKDK
jgi:hypothetical protein